jgi:hypothetical protein
MADPVLVVSLSRCGSSMACGVLAACGAEFGSDLRPADEYNPRGYWESLKGRKAFRRVIRPWEKRSEGIARWVPPSRAVRELRDAMAPHWSQATAMKIPVTWAFWPLIHAAYPKARWILVRRAVPDIVASSMRAPFMRAGGDSVEAWTEIVEASVARLVALLKTPVHAVEVWPDPRDPEVFRPMVEHAGLAWDETAVRDALDPTLWRGGAP